MRGVALLLLVLGAGCGADSIDLAVKAMNRGLVELESGRPAGAISLFGEALRLRPGWREARVNLAVACFHARDPRLRSLLEELGEEPHALFLRGVTLRMAGEAERALPAFCRLTEIAPDDEHVWCWLGLAARDAGHNEEAVAALSRSPSLRPARTVLRLLGASADAAGGRPIRGRYGDWGPLARAVNSFPGVDLPPATGGSWIRIRLVLGSVGGTMEDVGSARPEGEAARVVLRAGRRRMEGLEAHLGDATVVDYVQVRWPDGRLTACGPLAVNETVVLRESER